MTPGAGIHITRRPHPRPVAVFLRMGRVPISGRGRPVCGGNTPRIMNDRAIRPYHTRRPGPAARDPLTNVMGDTESLGCHCLVIRSDVRHLTGEFQIKDDVSRETSQVE